MKPNNLIYLKCTEDSFYRLWIEFLAPFHKLTARERDVAARIIYQYFRLKEEIADPEVLRDVMWSQKSRRDMWESLGMSPAHFQMVLARLRAAEILVDGDINPRFIPHKSDDPRFVLQVIYDWSTPQNPIRRDEKQD